MSEDYNAGDRVLITRQVRGDDGRPRQIKVVEDGIILARRFGHRGQWIQVLAPCTMDGRLINADPNLAEWFPTYSSYIRIVRTGVNRE